MSKCVAEAIRLRVQSIDVRCVGVLRYLLVTSAPAVVAVMCRRDVGEAGGVEHDCLLVEVVVSTLFGHASRAQKVWVCGCVLVLKCVHA